jgi:hypothetical protein
VFTPVKGAWGRAGSTLVRLEAADEATLASAIAMAFDVAASKKGRRGRRPSPPSSRTKRSQSA